MVWHRGMRRTILSALFFVAGYALANDAQFSPAEMSPELLSSGGAYISVVGGLPALFTNPAVLTRIPGTFSYYNQNAWIHNDLEYLFPTVFALLTGDGASSSDRNFTQLLENKSYGFGGSIVSGYYGNNFALAIALGHDLFVYGETYPTELYALFNNDIRVIIALAYPFEIEGIIDISLGFSIEPFYRIHTALNSAETLDLMQRYFNTDGSGASSFLRGRNTLYGGGVAVHSGILVVIDDLVSVGFAIRDIGETVINYSSTSLSHILSELSMFSVPENATPGEEGYGATSNFPTKFRLGVAYHPQSELLPTLKPRIFAEINETIFEDVGLPDYSVFQSLHIGASAIVNEWFSARVGLNQGQFTVGTGFDLGIFEIESAWFGRFVSLPEKRFGSQGIIISIHIDDEVERGNVRNVRNVALMCGD